MLQDEDRELLSQLDRLMRLTQHKPSGVEYVHTCQHGYHLCARVCACDDDDVFVQPSDIIKPLSAQPPIRITRESRPTRVSEGVKFQPPRVSTAVKDFLDHAKVWFA